MGDVWSSGIVVPVCEAGDASITWCSGDAGVTCPNWELSWVELVVLPGSNWSGGSWKVSPLCVHNVTHDAVATMVIGSCAWICTRYAAAARLSDNHVGWFILVLVVWLL